MRFWGSTGWREWARRTEDHRRRTDQGGRLRAGHAPVYSGHLGAISRGWGSGVCHARLWRYQTTRPTGESGRTARDSDARAWLRRGLRRAKRAWYCGRRDGGTCGRVPWGCVGRWACTPSWRCTSAHVGLAWRLTRRSRAFQSPAPEGPAGCLPVMATGDDPC